MYEIMVPCQWNTGKPIRTRHHQEWDKVVRKIAGGLTLFKPATGNWIDQNTKSLYAERVIPVRIACTEKQIKKIGEFTLRHYKQLAVMAYVISETVVIFHADKIKDDKDRQNPAIVETDEQRSSHP